MAEVYASSRFEIDSIRDGPLIVDVEATITGRPNWHPSRSKAATSARVAPPRIRTNTLSWLSTLQLFSAFVFKSLAQQRVNSSREGSLSLMPFSVSRSSRCSL